jgi:hypothetical protein
LDATYESSSLEQIHHIIKHIADVDKNINILDEDELLDEFNRVKNISKN